MSNQRSVERLLSSWFFQILKKRIMTWRWGRQPCDICFLSQSNNWNIQFWLKMLNLIEFRRLYCHLLIQTEAHSSSLPGTIPRIQCCRKRCTILNAVLASNPVVSPYNVETSVRVADCERLQAFRSFPPSYQSLDFFHDLSIRPWQWPGY